MTESCSGDVLHTQMSDVVEGAGKQARICLGGIGNRFESSRCLGAGGREIMRVVISLTASSSQSHNAGLARGVQSIRRVHITHSEKWSSQKPRKDIKIPAVAHDVAL